MKKVIDFKWVFIAFAMVVFTIKIAWSNGQPTNKEINHNAKMVNSTVSLDSVSRNTFMVLGNTYIKTLGAKTSILASINKAVEDAQIDFVIMVGELTIGASKEQFKAVKYVMANSPVPVYVTASNHDLAYDNGDWKTGKSDNYARFRRMLETETEYTISKGRSYFIMQSHIDSIGTNFTNNELKKLENNTTYDFVYHVIEVPLIGAINLDNKPVIGISGGSSKGVNINAFNGRHVRVRPTENKINDDEDDYLIFKENEGFVVVESYVDRSLNKSFKINMNRSTGTCSVETQY
ncbi:hypothetical protein MWU65_08875 [Cellulophaga sp. F20128]|uniref:hypothetical protein n=1 Tax=Cellulophaga sp. F20128 TaxID=2926413 RepID=UPI001FF378D1|nr:hypothetical protein [Cellulophaga sp. F20128]MCK0157287.1 hypothetical protein [Cellulophaga sp. F20128]